MILLKVNAIGVAILELERDAPRPIDVDGVALHAPERVKVEPRHLQFIKALCMVQGCASVRVEPPQASIMQGFLDLGRRPALEQFPQASMPKALDHEIINCNS
jgi:hypothetical protein